MAVRIVPVHVAVSGAGGVGVHVEDSHAVVIEVVVRLQVSMVV
jgi:hypothetical protein